MNEKLPSFDDAQYREMLGDHSMSEEQIVEFLRTLDMILDTFVDMAWGVDPVQLAMPELAKHSSTMNEQELNPEIEKIIENIVGSKGK